MREDKSFISCLSDPGFLPGDSWILFHCQVCTSTLGSSRLTSMWDFLLPLVLHFLFSLKTSQPLFPLLSSQSALTSDFMFIQSVPLIGSLIFYCLYKDFWHQQGSAEDTPFFLSFHSVIHSFVLKGHVHSAVVLCVSPKVCSFSF